MHKEYQYLISEGFVKRLKQGLSTALAMMLLVSLLSVGGFAPAVQDSNAETTNLSINQIENQGEGIGSPNTSELSFPNRIWEHAIDARCLPQIIDLISVIPRTDLGTIVTERPVVDINRAIRNEAIAERETISSDCSVETTALPFSWSLSLMTENGEFSDVSDELSESEGLSPVFIPDETGKYIIAFKVGDFLEELEIPIVPGQLTWWNSGPTILKPGNFAGHMSSIAIDPHTGDVYAGANSGGVWKSTDEGRSWHPLTDHKLPFLYIGSLAIARQTPDVDIGGEEVFKVYAGLIRQGWSTGGIFVSIDGGDNWEQSGADTSLCNNLPLTTSKVFRMMIHPFDANVVYAATDTGVYRTADGGGCWERVFGPNFVTDLAMTKTANPKIFIGVKRQGIYSANDADPTSWSFLNSMENSGLPSFSNPTSDSMLVSVGDRRLFVSDLDLASGLPPAGTFVTLGDPDVGRPLLNFVGGEVYDLKEKITSAYSPDEPVYQLVGSRSLDACAKGFWRLGIRAGDIRMTGSSAGTVIASGDEEIDKCVHPFWPREKFADTINPNPAMPVFDIGESIYLDSVFSWIVLATSDADPNLVYAGFEPSPYQIFKSNDGGNTWVESSRAPQTCDAGQCGGYDNFIRIDPINPNIVYVGQVRLFVSTNGGNNWKILHQSIEPGLVGSRIHPDQHDMAFDPHGPSFYVGNDGGIARFRLNDSRSPLFSHEFCLPFFKICIPLFSLPKFTPLNEGLITTQFYDIDVSPNDQFGMAGGLQDNGIVKRVNDGIWEAIGCGDGYRTEFDPVTTIENQRFYYDCYWGGEGIFRYPEGSLGSNKKADGGEWYAFGLYANPYKEGQVIRVDKGDGKLYRTTNALDNAVSWDCIDPKPSESAKVRAVDFYRPSSPTDADRFVVGMSDGSFHIITRNVPDTLGSFVDCSDPPPSGYFSLTQQIYPYAELPNNCVDTTGIAVKDIAIDPSDYNIIYATLAANANRRVIQLESESDGSSWCGHYIAGDSLSSSSPLPTFDHSLLGDIVVIPQRFNEDRIIFIGTRHAGLYQGVLSEGEWRWSLVEQVPNVEIRDLELEQSILTQDLFSVWTEVAAGTYGRGVFQLVRIEPHLPVIVPTVQELDSDKISDCQVHEFTGSAKNRAVQVNFEYTYSSDHGDTVSVRPVIIGEDGADYSRFFLTELQELKKGQGHSSLLVIYASENAPLSLNTEKIRLELFNDVDGTFFSELCNATTLWKSSDGRSLSISSLLEFDDGPLLEFSVPMHVVTMTDQSLQTPSESVFNKNTEVTVMAPEEIDVDTDTWQFVNWVVNGQTLDEHSSISLSMSEDVSLIATYEQSSQPQKVDLQILATKDIQVTVPTLFSVPIAYAYEGNPYKVITSFTTNIASITPGRVITIEVPQIIEENGETFLFEEWETPSGDFTETSLTIEINKDTTINARYNLAGDDTDNDGVPDSVDHCPNQPGPAANNGCPITTEEPVGGEILSIDMTTLLVAGAFANASWIIPIVGAAVAGIIGILVRRRLR